MLSGRNEPRRRSGRNGRRKGPPRSDALVVALTAQIMLCVLLLLALGTLKKVDESRYGSMKATYTDLTTTPGQFEQLFAQWNQVGFVGLIQQGIDYITRKATGNPPQPQETQPPPPVEAPPEESGPEARETFEYDYLSPTASGAGGLFELQGNSLEEKWLAAPRGGALSQLVLMGKAITPIEGIITSKYSYRSHPITGNADFHTGIDIAAEEGRNILAALPGTVTQTGLSNSYGHYITLQHEGGVETFYAHCSEIIAREGMVVRQGERIAKVGSTGISTGPHLHFSVCVDGQYTDPLWLLQDKIQVLE